MSPDQQRIAIAQACGWKNADHPDAMKLKEGWTMPEKWCMDPKGVLRFSHDKPDYLNDLNAMHEAEKVIIERGDEAMLDYDEELRSATDGWRWNATAAQRACAFLRTINKWEEAQ